MANFLGIFSGKSNHPLADPKSARELFERLNCSEPFAALDEIDSWLESISADVEIKVQRRVEVLFQLDDIGATATRKLTQEYLNLSGKGRNRNQRLWQVAGKFWRQMAAGYWSLLNQFEADKKLRESMQASLPAIQVRLLRAYGGCLKWDQFHYSPSDPDIWLGAGKIYLQAENGHWLDKKQTLSDGSQSTVATEYLRLMLFHAASMDSLPPLHIELAEHLLVYFLPAFSLTAQARPENAYWIDAGKPLPPTRLARLPEITPTLRFFATANALSAIEAVSNQVSATQAVPNELGLRQRFPVSAVSAVLQHLAAFCAATPATRSHARLQVKLSMKVASGFQSAFAALQGFEVTGDRWAMDDISPGGVRARAVLASHDGLGVGSLVAMCPDGGDNWLIGILRRFARQSPTQGSVGIEIIGRSPRAVTFDSEGLSGEGLLLESMPDTGEATLLVVSPGIWQDARPLTFTLGAKRYQLRPSEEQQRGNDYVIGRYWTYTVSE